MKVCMCSETLNRIVKFAVKGGMTNAIFKKIPVDVRRVLVGKKLGLSPKFAIKLGRSARRKSKKHFSRKQLAAQRLFAKRARAGTLRKGRRKRRRR